MKRRPGTTWLGAVLGLALALASGCSTIRATARDWNNDDMLGKPAPALETGSWVRPVEASAATGELPPWRLCVFLKLL